MAIENQASRREQVESNVNTCSSPSDLRISDMRMAVVCSNYDYPLIRIDTNQGVYGLGEARDAGHKENALQFKSFLLGENPLNIDKILRSIRHFGGHGRQGGGYSGIELALYDLIGRVYGVPCYQLLGGRYRDKVRIYADTPSPAEPTPEGYAERVKGRVAMGMTFCKFDLSLNVLAGVEGALVGKPSAYDYDPDRRWTARGTVVRTQLTERGIERYVEIVAAVREAVGWDIPLCIDHLGDITLNDAIRLGRALEPFGLAWIEDVLPWQDIEGNRLLTRAIEVPTLTGEDIYLLDGFKPLIDQRAVDIIQPDLLTAGGMLETKRIADYAEVHNMPTVLHCASSPIGYLANLHCAAAIPSLIALENHALDLPFWKDLVTGLPDPWLEEGFIAVPEKPGLGVDLNLEGIEENLRFPGLFEPTEEWNTPKLGFWQPDKRWDK